VQMPIGPKPQIVDDPLTNARREVVFDVAGDRSNDGDGGRRDACKQRYAERMFAETAVIMHPPQPMRQVVAINTITSTPL
jgi:hypothetical protein